MNRCEPQSARSLLSCNEPDLASKRLAGMDCANQPLYRTDVSCANGRRSTRREVRWQQIIKPCILNMIWR
jgi:hypothetical protein